MWGSREWWGLEETGEFMSFVKGELLLISNQMLQFKNVGLVIPELGFSQEKWKMHFYIKLPDF